MTNSPNPFRWFDSSPEVIRLVVMMYVRYPLSLRNVEDLLFERGIDICHETVRLWWNRFGPMFAAEVRRRRVGAPLASSPVRRTSRERPGSLCQCHTARCRSWWPLPLAALQPTEGQCQTKRDRARFSPFVSWVAGYRICAVAASRLVFSRESAGCCPKGTQRRRNPPRNIWADNTLFGHGHILRVLAARWIELPPQGSQHFLLGTGTLCELDSYQRAPAIKVWNGPLRG